ncbi:alpha-amylase family glycosyl hydrolase [Kordiimonas sp.]|uniref:alpha-amylase family glycosyl hydrolase n=1 Tax=Kordiimonas sp. TaxID=1970157 RepID=UPI003B51BEA9
MRKSSIGNRLLAATAIIGCLTGAVFAEPATPRPEALKPYTERPITDDIMYFVMPDRFANGDESNDRGGMEGSAIDHGFDPSHKGFYHGGDLKGLTEKLDYLADMGVSAIWLTPIFKNKPTQGNVENVTAAYHGYWITDFTQIDPHLGTNDDLKAFVAAAHARNMKVIFDIITNHTADVIKYQECLPEDELKADGNVPLCDYRSKADYPYTTIGKADGAPINDGFMGDEPAQQTTENFAKLTNQNFAYTPYIPEGEQNVKVPSWLNDIRYYHNRGDSEWKGESSLYGDFSGLDDLFTEHPYVTQGFIDIYKFWISEFKIDGFRIDTVRHVNDSFWQTFAPAIVDHAKAEGISQFYVFGEVYDGNPEHLSHFTRVAKLPAVLDFGFQWQARQVIADGKAPALLKEFYAHDHLYDTAWSSASILPTFLGNHDMGRIGRFIVTADNTNPAEALDRSKLAHALMYLTRGVPVVYYGDEQGFTGDGHDQDAREDMFPSKVAVYNDNQAIGSTVTPEADNFDPSHPLYTSLTELASFRMKHGAVRGGEQKVLFADDKPGIFAIERSSGSEALVIVFNTSSSKAKAKIEIAAPLCWVGGAKASLSTNGTTTTVSMPPLSWSAHSLNGCTNE